MKIFVFLSPKQSINYWQENIASDENNPFNHSTPYGYGNFTNNATDSVEFNRSDSHKFTHRLLNKLLPSPLWNLVVNYKAIKAADVIWTHTEAYSLLLAFINKFRRRKFKVIGQWVWLIDKWQSLNGIQKYLIKNIAEELDVIFLHSPLNFEKANEIFPECNFKLVKYGVKTVNYLNKENKTFSNIPKFKIIGVGNDIHRDWLTFINSIKELKDVEGIIVSKNIPKDLKESLPPNITIRDEISNFEELLQLYSICQILVVPLTENLHASGLTVIEEGLINHIPTICAFCGGLDYYFDDKVVDFYSVGDADSLRNLILSMKNNYASFKQKANLGVEYLIHNNITSKDYVHAYWEYSKKIID